MKRQEKVHLKEDPFVEFIERVMVFTKTNRRYFLLGLAAIFLIGSALGLFYWLHSSSVEKENLLLMKAVEIKNNKTLSYKEKIDQLQSLKKKGSLSGIISIYIAQAWYEQRDYQKALSALKKIEHSKEPHIRDSRRILQADSLCGQKKYTDALSILNQMVEDSQTKLAKEYILLKIARINIAQGKSPEARTLLKKASDDFPDSVFSSEIHGLLESLGEK